MQEKRSIKPSRFKLHIKTTLVISAVLIAVFAVLVYFANSATTRLGDRSEREGAQLLATRIADTVEHHVKHLRKTSKTANANAAETIQPNWTDIEEAISETILSSHPELAQIRVFSINANQQWQETIRWPLDIGEVSANDRQAIEQQFDNPKIITVSENHNDRFIKAVAPAIVALDNGESNQIASVCVILHFDESHSYAAILRRLIGPLIVLAILAITVTTFFLFRYLVYRPIDNLLAAMSKAEAGNLRSEVPALSNDEIGLLTSRFNRMLSRIRQMTEQLNLEQQLLEERVREATAEIANRKDQLEENNLRLFELQRQLTQFERLAAAGQLAAQFAHEVGTPLNLISGHVQLLRVHATNDKVSNRLDVIGEQIERITKIVRAMLDSTRRPQPKLASLDINFILEQILEAAQPTLLARKVQLTTNLAAQQLNINADPDQMQQVFINLLNNSLDAMPEGGSLRVSSWDDNSSAIIEVSDSGEGIDKDKIDFIFDPLFSTKKERGTGLGLTIVKQIIFEHGGDIKVTSEVGFGTKFFIRLPLLEAVIKQPANVNVKTLMMLADSSPSQRRES
jgi:signal transduction histidine kinase